MAVSAPVSRRGITNGDPAPVASGSMGKGKATLKRRLALDGTLNRRASAKAQRHKMAGAGTCEFCGWAPPEKRILHAHHVIPRARGGGDVPRNIAVLCPNHHALAHYMSPRGHTAGYCGPKTKAHLFRLLRIVETGDKAAMESALARLRYDYVQTDLARLA